MAKHIIVLDDRETWQEMIEEGNITVWQITDGAYEELMDGSYPKHLDEVDILGVTSICPTSQGLVLLDVSDSLDGPKC